ncbi:mersacidin/lichenicidin family type 2 lantibiotic [Dictyobacter aurantiacus]|uniref:Mersacidin/lichenicidin family type 2 lantibiotic n=1 Tax=Dictyobacter aurantiacus TaxID=1936993 RepID=A0A401ZQA0_9CHLR|nr:mersacidin/lichenicidin family type 2 lantibiotic [Dictyobacter aurantiacus]GCE09051.1 hypothetical protein KDAU_63800 [Dictyobacter aurantiacus]
MSLDIARAWKDAQYRGTLTSEELAQLPENPVGALELTDNDLASVSGAYSVGVPGAASSTSGYGAGAGLNINLTGCCATGNVGGVYPSTYGGGASIPGTPAGSWHLSYVYDAGASVGPSVGCSSPSYYTSCNIC